MVLSYYLILAYVKIFSNTKTIAEWLVAFYVTYILK